MWHDIVTLPPTLSPIREGHPPLHTWQRTRNIVHTHTHTLVYTWAHKCAYTYTGAHNFSVISYTGTKERNRTCIWRNGCPCSIAGFNSCIIAVPRLNPASVMEQVLPLLQPSTPFVIYSQWVQPLAECYHYLMVRLGAMSHRVRRKRQRLRWKW